MNQRELISKILKASHYINRYPKAEYIHISTEFLIQQKLRIRENNLKQILELIKKE